MPSEKLRYTCDFGDDWEHDLLLEEIQPERPGEAYPSCVAGKGACPPEDCGRAWGYAELKEILADPGHEQHEEMLDRLCLDLGPIASPGVLRRRGQCRAQPPRACMVTRSKKGEFLVSGAGSAEFRPATAVADRDVKPVAGPAVSSAE